MRTYFAHPFVAIALSMTAINTAYASEEHQGAQTDIELLDFIDVQHLNEETLFDIMEGRLPSIAIEFPKNLQLPLEVFIEGDVVSLIDAENMPAKVQFNRSIYLRNIHGKLYLSTDLKTWKPFEAFVRGRLQVGLKIDKEVGPEITLGAELYERQRQ